MSNIVVSASLPWSDGSGPDYKGPYTELAASIVLQAVKDYMAVLHRSLRKGQTLNKKRQLLLERADFEEFFHSGWYEMLSDIDPDRLIRACRDKAVALEKEKIRKQNRKRMMELQRLRELPELPESNVPQGLSELQELQEIQELQDTEGGNRL